MKSDEQLKQELGRVIGLDYNYKSSEDLARHFDPWPIIEGYAVFLLLDFVKAAGSKLKENLEKWVKDSGAKIGDAIWNAISRMLRIKETPQAGPEQNAELNRATDALKEVSHGLDDKQKETFLQAGELAVKNQLVQDNFPEEIAAEKAKRFVEIVRGQMSS